MRRVVVYAGTRNLYHAMTVALKSLLHHTQVDRVVFLIEDDEFPEYLPPVVEALNVSGQAWFPPEGPNYESHWTYMTMMRLAVPFLLPEEDFALWLDVDTIVHRDIGPVFGIDLMDNCFGAAREPSRGAGQHLYFNAGVLLMNLRELRDSGKAAQLVWTVNHQGLPCVDQDAINRVCDARILEISPEYNSCRFTELVPSPRIVHHAADREYHRCDDYKTYDQMGW